MPCLVDIPGRPDISEGKLGRVDGEGERVCLGVGLRGEQKGETIAMLQYMKVE